YAWEPLLLIPKRPAPNGGQQNPFHPQHIRIDPSDATASQLPAKPVLRGFSRNKPALWLGVPPSLPARLGMVPTRAWDPSQAHNARIQRAWTRGGTASSTKICSLAAAANSSAPATPSCRCRQC